MQWNEHAQEFRNCVLRTLNGLKIIRKKMHKQQSLTVVTSQVFSILYYASPVWLTPSTCKATIKEVEKPHFSGLRIVVRYHKQGMKREVISRRTNCLHQIDDRFAAATLLRKIWSTRSPNKLRTKFF